MAGYADVTILLDRSGSMKSMGTAVVEKINDFISTVRSEKGDGCWTLIQFDDPSASKGAGEEFLHVVFENVDDSEVKLLRQDQFEPRSGTALVDAVCMTIKRIRERAKNLPDTDMNRNRKFMLVIITDGEENSSREFSTDKMRELIGLVTSEGWKILYLGANQDAFANVKTYGMAQNMSYQGLAVGSHNAYPFEATAGGLSVAISSGAMGARAWKADDSMPVGPLSSAQPDLTLFSGIAPDAALLAKVAAPKILASGEIGG